MKKVKSLNSALRFLSIYVFSIGACSISNVQAPKDAQHFAEAQAALKNQTVIMDDFNFIVTKETPYYLDGPWQGRAPDGTMKEGTKLRILKDIGSYLLVESPTRLRAYVSSDDLTKLN